MGRFVDAILGIQNNKSISRLRTEEELLDAMSQVFPAHLRQQDVVFFCIGTARVIGDSLGPIVGSMLKGMGYTNVKGSVEDPIHAKNFSRQTMKKPMDKKIIAIDAAVGSFSHLHTFSFVKGSLHPGVGVGTELPPIGDFGIMGITDLNQNTNRMFLPEFEAHSISQMAAVLVSALVQRFSK